MRRTVLAAVALTAGVLLAGCGGAADPAAYPEPGTKVEWIVPSAPGGANDILARVVAPVMAETLGASISVVNKEGGSQVLGLDHAARSEPDGTTIVYTNIPSILGRYLDPSKKASFDRSSFTPIGSFGSNTVVIGVPKDSPYDTVGELFAAMKAAPGTVSAATDSRAGDDHVNLRILERDLGLDMNVVHYNSGADKVASLVSGESDMALGGIGSFLGQYRSGDVKLLAVVDEQPSTYVPEVPTLRSAGFDVEPMTNNFAVSVPAATPAPIVEKLEAALRSASEDPAVREKLAGAGATPAWLPGAEVATLWAEREQQVAPVIAELLQEQQ